MVQCHTASTSVEIPLLIARRAAQGTETEEHGGGDGKLPPQEPLQPAKKAKLTPEEKKAEKAEKKAALAKKKEDEKKRKEQEKCATLYTFVFVCK